MHAPPCGTPQDRWSGKSGDGAWAPHPRPALQETPVVPLSRGSCVRRMPNTRAPALIVGSPRSSITPAVSGTPRWGRGGPKVAAKGPRAGGEGGFGACAIKAEWVCRLVLPGVRTCSPFEEGILRVWIRGLVVHPSGWGGRGRMKKNCDWGGGGGLG